MQKSNFLFFSFFLCLFSNLYSQNIIFTDPNFKQALLNHTPVINTDGNNEISYDEAKVITRLDLDNKNISNLDGIQYFINLDILNCSNNSITKIDASHTSTLTKLRFITARYNNIHTVDVRTCPLWGLRLDGNNIKYAYLTGPSTFLVEASSGIYFELDRVEYVCISQAQYDTQDNNVSHQGFWDNIGSALHIGECTIVPPPICQIINFPDPNFKQALLNHTPVIDTDGDGEICIDEAEAVGTIYILDGNINDITGIEKFINLSFLFIQKNPLNIYNLTNNTKLETLVFAGCGINSIDVSNNTMLKILSLPKNNLTSINLSSNYSLEYLSLGLNQISSIDLSQNIALKGLDIQENNLSQLNVEANLNLEGISVHQNNLTELNITNNLELRTVEASDNEIKTIDLSNNSKLEQVDISKNEITEIDIRDINSLDELLAYGNPNLETVYLSGNHGFYQNLIQDLWLQNCPKLNFVCVEPTYLSQTDFYIKNTLGYFSCTVSSNCDDANAAAFSDYFLLSPNPGVTYMNLTKKDSLIKSKIATILTLTGQVVKTINLSFQSNGGFSIPSFDSGLSTSDGLPLESAYLDISDIIPGSYILSVSSNLGTLTTQFIKQ